MKPLRLDGLAQRLGGVVPVLLVPDGLLRLGRQVCVDLLEAEGTEHRKAEAQHLKDLVPHLVGGDEEVGIILRKAADTEQAMERPRLLVAVDGAKLGPTEWQLTIGVLAVLVDHDMEGTVHRLDVVVALVHLHRRVHPLLVEAEVTALLPEPGTTDVGGIDHLIAVCVVLRPPEVLDLLPDAGPLGVPVDQAGSRLLMEREEVELLAQAPVVPPLDIGDALQIEAQLLAILPGCPVDAGQHRIGLLAPPVRPGDAHELERSALQLLGRGDMGAAAEVDEGSEAVEGDLLILFDCIEQLELEALVLEAFMRLLATDHRPLELEVLGYDRLHAGGDLLKILVHQLPGQVKVIVESILNRRPDRNLGAGKHLEHCLGHDVGHRVPDPGELLSPLFTSHTISYKKEPSRLRLRSPGKDEDMRALISAVPPCFPRWL